MIFNNNETQWTKLIDLQPFFSKRVDRIAYLIKTIEMQLNIPGALIKEEHNINSKKGKYKTQYINLPMILEIVTLPKEEIEALMTISDLENTVN